MALFWLTILSVGFPGSVPPEAIYFPFHQALTFGNETKRQLTSMTDSRGSFCCFLNKAKQGKNDALKNAKLILANIYTNPSIARLKGYSQVLLKSSRYLAFAKHFLTLSSSSLLKLTMEVDHRRRSKALKNFLSLYLIEK